jgi:hypothetical protein
MKPRILPPTCMGRRMASSAATDRPYYWITIPEISRAIRVYQRTTGMWHWSVERDHRLEAIGSRSGPQAASNAAQRYLVSQAERTLKLAGRRAA